MFSVLVPRLLSEWQGWHMGPLTPTLMGGWATYSQEPGAQPAPLQPSPCWVNPAHPESRDPS